MKPIYILILSILFIFAHTSDVSAQNPFGTKKLELKQGTKVVGGSFGLDFMTMTPEGEESQSGVLISVAPRGGYFISDNVAITAGFSVVFPKGDLYANTGTSYTFGVGAVFYHQINNFYVYGGFEAGYTKLGTITADNNNIKKENLLKSDGDSIRTIDMGGSTQTVVIFPGGILLPITDSMALDLGIKLIYIIDDFDNSLLYLSIGWFGIQGFF
jgi:hypothetical protein